MAKKQITVPVYSALGNESGKYVVIDAIKDAYLEELTEAEAKDKGEVRWQVQEGREYEFEFTDGLYFAEHPAISSSVKTHIRGRIRPQNYVGRFEFRVLDNAGNEFGKVLLESISVKLEYRSDYRQMLADVSEQTAELLMASEEYVLQSYRINPEEEAETLYQQFLFIRSLVDSEDFDSAVARICASPLRKMMSVLEEKPISHSGRLGRSEIRQIASGTDRVPVQTQYSWLKGKDNPSLPRRIWLEQREETTDILENRFVKYVLRGFRDFSLELAEMKNAGRNLKREALLLSDKIDSWLSDPFFREIGELDRMSINSPALQRKEGYREVLKGWLMFESAAGIAWTGGEDVYGGGKKNVAVLYEYWVFFQLVGIVSKVFRIDPKSLDQLIVSDSDKIELALKQGRFKVIRGVTPKSLGERQLKVEFTYNRTFHHKNDPEKLEAGSWSVDMRPDYTLTVYPDAYHDASLAEKLGLSVHLHFDAKYRIQSSRDVFVKNSTEEELDIVKEEESKGLYKRADILKMHAYNDAIRRTYGSYVIFPGTNDERMDRFFEILPGIGAFVLRPDKSGAKGVSELERFISSVADSLVNRVTQREHMSNLEMLIRKPGAVTYAALSADARRANIPTYNSNGKPFIPAEETALIGYVRGQAHLDWIANTGLYNFRAGNRSGALDLTADILKADYLLLHGNGPGILKILKIDRAAGIRIATGVELVKKGYPFTPGGDLYLLITVGDEVSFNVDFNVGKLSEWTTKGAHGAPMTATFEDLLVHCC